VLEEELASTLKVLMREGNTLSAQIRQAWDSGDIRTLTKKPLVATGAHISILAHITQEELTRYLSNTEMANGFANRFLWVYVKRSKELPDGGQFHRTNVEPLIKRIRDVVNFSSSVTEIERDDDARQLWHSVYGVLSNGTGGVIGMSTNRGEAQVMRLSCLYALLDCSHVVREEHLKAALALWDYCYKSARYIFGDHGVKYDRNAEAILQALETREDGLTRTEVSKIFGNNMNKERLDSVINKLLSNGYIQVIKERKPNSKKPVQKIISV
jgi:predicted transcriptional regulator